MSLTTHPTRDVALLRTLLNDDPARAAYLLGDLDAPYFDHCRWFVALAHERPVAVLLSFEALSKPVLLSHGAPDGVAAILDAFAAELAPDCWAKIPLAHRDAFERVYTIVQSQNLWTMELRRFFPVADAAGIVPLGERDVQEMLPLYASGAEHYFEASQMPAAIYFGRHEADRLVSIAGTHVFSPRERVAVLGNIVTAEGARNRGHARAVTSRLIEELHCRGCATIALQVAADNQPAIAVYRRLGFLFRDVILQSRCERTGS
jgi:ribosomal protein S18 acetylase RimI-like enzyme